MKKISLIALLAITIGTLHAQVKSVTLDSTKAIVGGGNIHYSVVTTTPTDTFYTKVEVAINASFTSPFQTPYWVRNIGSGSFMDIIGKPLVDTLVLSYVRVIATDDTTKVGTKSNNLSLTPKHQVLKPTIYSVSVNTTTSSMTEQIGYTTGYADSSNIKCEVALDSFYAYQTNSKNWTVFGGTSGFLNYTVTGLKDNKQFFTRWTITNSAGLTVIKNSFITISNAAKIWMRKPADTVKVTSSTCDIKGRAISYGLTGTVWATISGATVSNIYNLTGVSEEWYTLNITGLTQSKTYNVWVHGKNSKGEDSFLVSITTPKYFNPTFKVTTIMTSASSDGTGEAWASYNVPKGQTANFTVGLFADWDSLCTNTLQDSTYVLGEGTGQLYKRFTGLTPGVYWIWFWGTCSDGQYELLPAPLKLSIWYTGITSVTTPTISVYPNPTTDFLHLSSSCSYHVYNEKGQIVLQGKSSEIDVTQLPVGKYIFKTETFTKQFLKN